MINNIISVSTMGLVENDIVKINKPIDDILLIEDDCNIEIASNLYVTILDKSNGKNIAISCAQGSTVKYIIVDSASSNRVFNVSGELLINQISLEETAEKLNVNLLNENASCDIKNLVIAAKTKNSFAQYVDHLIGNTKSNIINVGVAINGANIKFDTTGKVEKGMAKSKCSQLSRGIVMDDESQITALPILLIDEFDCFANHGATIGKMSDEDLFYLMSRGLSKDDAFLLILSGIIKPFIDDIPNEELQNKINEKIQNLIKK